METARSNLERLFAPRSVAVVGASTTPAKAGYQAVLALEGFAGDVYPINPKAAEVLGRKAFRSLSDIGSPVDLVLFAIPAAGTVPAVREAIDCNCGAGLILSGGFAESGELGVRTQAELEALCERSAFRVLGPNTAGFVNMQLPLTASFVAGADRIPAGEIAVVAQSAGVNLTVSFLLEKLGYGVSLAVGLGNAIDVDAADVLDFLAERPGTRAIALHLEGVQYGRRLFETLERVTPKTPVVALTVGRQDVGEFARSHTGNLIGSYALRASALRQAGAVVVESTEELAAAAAVLSLGRLAAKSRAGIGVLTAQAGPGLLILDYLKSHDVSVPSLMDSTRARIAEQLPGMTYMENPVDTGRPGPSFGEVLLALGEDPRIDAILAYALDEPAALHPAEVLPRVAEQLRKPLVFGTMGPREAIAPVIDSLRARRIYTAESPETLARAACVLAEDAARQERLARDTLPRQPPPRAIELPQACDEDAAKRVLEAIGIPTPKRVVCASRAAAEAAFRRFDKPVALKILATEVAHKTEVGGVHLNIASEEALHTALAELDEIPLRAPRRYLMEEMAPPGLDVIVGAVRDASFGPTVLVGLGGTKAEIFRDTATRLAPLSLAEAHEMIDELRSASLFDGFRGGVKLSRQALAGTVVDLGRLLSAHPGVKELEINPLRVYTRNVLALDALLTCESPPRVRC